MASITTAEIAKLLAGEVVGDSTATLTGFAPANQAKPGDLTFAENDDYFAAAENSAATAIIAGKNTPAGTKILIRVGNPRVAFAKAVGIFFPEPKFAPGIHPSAVIANSAKINPSAHIAKNCTEGNRVTIGA